MSSEPKVGTLLTCPIYGDARDIWFDGTKICAPSPDSARLLSAALTEAREMREVLAAVEWVPDADGIADPSCPLCFHSQRQGHSPDCRLARLVGGGK